MNGRQPAPTDGSPLVLGPHTSIDLDELFKPTPGHILGTTGMGKTRLMETLIEEAIRAELTNKTGPPRGDKAELPPAEAISPVFGL